MTDSADRLVVARRVSHAFDVETTPKQVLFDIDFDLAPGEFVILSGPSGAGKTTLLTLIGALRALQSGSLRVFGKELFALDAKSQRDVRQRIGFVFQEHNLFEALTAAQTLSLTLKLALRRMDEQASRASATALLDELNMGPYIDSKPGSLSTGQNQRIAIARALIHHPQLILADEPTASLDVENARLVIELLKRRAVDGEAGILMVTHDHRVFPFADRIVNLLDGRTV